MDRKKNLFGGNYRTRRDDILRRARGEVSGYTNDMTDKNTELEKDQEPERMSSAEVESIFQKGMKYYNGDGVKENKYEAFQLFKTAAENGHAEAQFAVATFYEEGGWKDVVEEDTDEALKWLKLSAEKGNAKAQFELGRHYDMGKGVEEDEKMALRYYKMSADNGCLDGMYYLSLSLLRDNDKEAVNTLKKAAEQGHCPSQYFLGEVFANGYCGEKEDMKKAFLWKKKAAENDGYDSNTISSFNMLINWFTSLRDAMYDLAHFYYDGDDVPEDKYEAFKWFKEAALKNHHKAQVWVGICYYLGNGTGEDNEKAEYFIEKARDEATDSDDIEFINKVIEMINKDGIIYIEPKHS